MALKSIVKDLKEVDEKYHDLYEKTDDGYILGVDDSDLKSKIDEFRKNNITYKGQIEDLQALADKVKDIDPAKYAEMKKTIDDMQDKKLLAEGDVEALLEQRTERMRLEQADKVTKLEERATKAETQVTTYQGQLNTITVNDSITRAISAVGSIKEGALPDILARASKQWGVNDEGKLEALDASGSVIYGKDGKDPISVDEWSNNLLGEAPFLFEANAGGGAGGSGVVKPGTKTVSNGDHWDGDEIAKVASGEITVVE